MNSSGLASNTTVKRRGSGSATIGVLVLGMHRSGTSALTRVLNLLGCALPEALVGPSEGNEMGHWEAASAVTLDDEILESAGSNWNDWGPINPDWQASGVRTQMLERAVEVIREHKSLGPLFALKDPRLCRLADLWLEAGDAAGVDMRVVLMLRHPVEVAASLESRDLMAPGFAELLWLRHALDAEHLSRGRKRVVCRFDRLLQDWQETVDQIRQGLSVALPRNSPKAHAEIDRFLTRDMRHHDAKANAGLGLLSASGWLKRTFDILHRWSEQGEDLTDHDELDRIRTEFDHAYSAFSRLLLSTQLSGEFASGSRLRDSLLEQQAQVAERAQEIENQAAEIAQLRVQGSELTDKIAALSAAYETIQQRAEALQAEADELLSAAARAAELDAEIDGLRKREAELAEKAGSLSTARDSAQAEIETLRGQLGALQPVAARAGELDEEVKRRGAREAELEQEVARLGAREAELDGEVARLGAREAALAKQAEELGTRLANTHAETEGERKLRTNAERTITEREAELASEKLRNSELSGQIAAADSAARQRQEELAQLWDQLGTVQRAAGASAAEVTMERGRRNDAEAQLAAAIADLRGMTARNGELEVRARIAEAALTLQAGEQQRLSEQLAEASTSAGKAAAEATRERDLRVARESQLAKAESNLAELSARLVALEKAPPPAPHGLYDEIAQLTRLLHKHETEAASASAARAAAEQRVAEQSEELVRLTTILSQENAQAVSSAGQSEWLRDMTHAAERMPKWWALMPEGWRRKREHEVYRRAGLFDADQYLQNYPDVLAHGMDPVRHYILHGMAEGRQFWR